MDRERCVSSGQCATWAPEVFGHDEEDGRVVLLEQADGPAVRNAVKSCPSRAITLR
ncbi:ferredoxin [Nonomuraea typhae]|uniref:Ferredoxin n=1 Tax=Nonomuraea typhae TaxID=2603600 RepID=A0ABW7YJK7_9ACTN